ncbi:hypothetical protein BT96DRAFT_1004734 [Gymnopus androsaceus JB14]|uniref:ARM repeat-containing protein n=1 Tax=Gymnopus androsaceus JB14 TaxID=1447944 RepID=A0A6A4GR51_9AGAR|nr:hypothetical protein BT96DRAFT_1004734 [Gymnopus androsaceus JB14]
MAKIALLLQDTHPDVQIGAVKLFSEMSKQEFFQDAISAQVPTIRKLLRDVNSDVQEVAATILSRHEASCR